MLNQREVAKAITRSQKSQRRQRIPNQSTFWRFIFRKSKKIKYEEEEEEEEEEKVE